MSDEKLQDDNAPLSSKGSKLIRMATVDMNPYFAASSKKTKRLPEWLDHFNARDLKILFKCSMAAWIYTLFLLLEPTLKVIGQATFFGVLVLFMVPPSGVIFIGVMAGATIIIGACLGWAWGTITMKAALATRPVADLQKQYARLQQSNTMNTTNAQQASGQSTYLQIAIYNGAMLDTRVSVTYFCMIGLFIYLVARIRVKAPKLTLVSIFAMIISDIYLTIAPLIPTFQGTIPRTLVLPASIAVGVSFVCNILFFPRSTSHLVLDGMQDLLHPMNLFLEACLLNLQNPDQHMELSRLAETRVRLIQGFKALEGNFGFLALDASVGRWSADDVKSLHDPLRGVVVMFISLLQTQVARIEHKMRDERLDQVMNYIDTERRESMMLEQRKSIKAGTHHLAKLYDFRQRSYHPDRQKLLAESLLAMASASDDLFNVCQKALDAVLESLRMGNTRRWFHRMTPQECEEICTAHTAILETLTRHKERFPGTAAKDLWKSHKYLFDEDGTLIAHRTVGFAPPLSGIMLSLVIEERLYHFATALEVMLSKVVELERQRTTVRLWLPRKLQYLVPWALQKDVSANTMSSAGANLAATDSGDEIQAAKESAANTVDKKTQSKKKKKGKKGDAVDDDDANTAKALMQRMKVRGVARRKPVGKLLIDIAHWFSNTEGMYALRVLIVTMALGAPAAVPSSAGFFYREKGLWGLIMAQTALLPYTADFVASFFMRLAGTVIGALTGLAMWYIGAGSGPGNPYGMAAIAVPIILVFMWIRLFTNPAFLQGVVLTVVTCYLVMAYSWVDTHIPSYGNPGVGIEVFWRRLLLVMVGFTAAAIVTFFPRPPSASKHHRRLLAESLQTVKNQYALFFASCSRTMPDLKEVAEKTAIDCSDMLLALDPQLKLLKFEFSTSNFDAKSLGTICHICMTLNQTITSLLVYTMNLPEEIKQRFLRTTGATTESLAADIMAVLSLVQQCLKTGDPLPATLPIPLIVRSMEGSEQRMQGDEHIINLNEERLAEEGVRKYCSAMSAFVQFLNSIDALVIEVKKAVGETTWVDVGDMARTAGV